MRVLILSCNTGGGHNSCAGAVREAFIQQGISCDTADALHFVSDKLSKFMSWGHTTMYRHIPGLFRKGYDFAEKHPGQLDDDTAVYKLLTGGTEKLYAYLQQGRYDTVICTHIFSGMLLCQTQKEYPATLRTAFIGTDYTCSPGTAVSDLDLYFIPDPSLTEEFVSKGVPRDRIIPSGIPIRQDFYRRENKAQAKQKLGLDPAHTHLLMMCGSMGCGPMEKLTEQISGQLEKNMVLTIVCGTNEKLQSRLTEQYNTCANLHIHGFVTDMNALLDSADLYLTKPGGLSTTEAAVKALPMVFINAVDGCEAYNQQFFTTLGGAVTADSTQALSELCIALMQDEERRARMQAALDSLKWKNAAETVCDILTGH